MDPRCIGRGRTIIASFVPFLLFLLVVFSSSVIPAAARGGGNGTTVPFRSAGELLRFKRIKARLAKTRDASVKTIQACILQFLACRGSLSLVLVWLMVLVCRVLMVMSSTACRRTCSRRSSIPSYEGKSQRYVGDDEQKQTPRH